MRTERGPPPAPRGRPLHCLRPTWSLRECLVLALHWRVPSASKREAQTLGVGQSHPLRGGFRVGRGVGPTFSLKRRQTAVGSLPTGYPLGGEAQPQSRQTRWRLGASNLPLNSEHLHSRQPPASGPPPPREPLPPRQVAWDGTRSSAQIPFPESWNTSQGSLGLQGRAAAPQ